VTMDLINAAVAFLFIAAPYVDRARQSFRW
jgi:hypothetical protein